MTPRLVQTQGEAAVSAAPDADPVRLVEQALRGSRSSIRAVVARCTPVITVRARRFLARRRITTCGGLELQDLVQEVWFTLLRDGARALRTFDPSRSVTFEQYLVMLTDRSLQKLAERELHTQKRGRDYRLVPFEPVTTPDAGPSPEEHVAGRQEARALGGHLAAQLPPRGQLICSLLYDEMLTADEIALKIGVSKQVVYNWQHRIRKLAAAFLAPAGAASIPGDPSPSS